MMDGVVLTKQALTPGPNSELDESRVWRGDLPKRPAKFRLKNAEVKTGLGGTWNEVHDSHPFIVRDFSEHVVVS
jgi:hypothetical protein